MTMQNPVAKLNCIAAAVLCWLIMARIMQKDRLSPSARALFIVSLSVFFYIQYLAISFVIK